MAEDRRFHSWDEMETAFLPRQHAERLERERLEDERRWPRIAQPEEGEG